MIHQKWPQAALQVFDHMNVIESSVSLGKLYDGVQFFGIVVPQRSSLPLFPIGGMVGVATIGESPMDDRVRSSHEDGILHPNGEQWESQLVHHDFKRFCSDRPGRLHNLCLCGSIVQTSRTQVPTYRRCV